MDESVDGLEIKVDLADNLYGNDEVAREVAGQKTKQT